MNVARLKQALSRQNLTVDEVATAIGIDPSTYYRKMNSEGETFTVSQAKKLASVLQLSGAEASEIFFGEELA